MSQNERDESSEVSHRPTDEDRPRVIRAESLFAGSSEVLIELNGVYYRLRITRRGKLILQK